MSQVMMERTMMRKIRMGPQDERLQCTQRDQLLLSNVIHLVQRKNKISRVFVVYKNVFEKNEE